MQPNERKNSSMKSILSTRRPMGFTLIELLIVVAIIAILAAIAVPNFLEAQTRAKVSRARADIRSIATALEAYFVDNNKYPPTPFVGPGASVLRVVPTRLSTPISYISTANLLDPFVSANVSDFQVFTPSGTIMTYSGDAPDPEGFDPLAGQRYYYAPNLDARRSATVQQALLAAQAIEGLWSLASYGPNRKRDFFTTNLPGNPSVLVPYDPSNGTISDGDIVRTQKESEGKFRTD